VKLEKSLGLSWIVHVFYLEALFMALVRKDHGDDAVPREGHWTEYGLPLHGARREKTRALIRRALSGQQKEQR
jgi:hypothetical protein